MLRTWYSEHGLEIARYFSADLPPEESEHGRGRWYAEFSDSIVRRQFEVYENLVLVAPYDIGFADQYQILLDDPHYRVIPHAAFESAWKQFAEPRLAQIASGT